MNSKHGTRIDCSNPMTVSEARLAALAKCSPKPMHKLWKRIVAASQHIRA